jgi:hypothetical protein
MVKGKERKKNRGIYVCVYTPSLPGVIFCCCGADDDDDDDDDDCGAGADGSGLVCDD